MPLSFEPLGRHHDRASFSSEAPELDDWFRHRAGQDERRNVARVFVALDDISLVVGFYSLSSSAIPVDDLPEALSRRLPRYEAIPTALIGRLARDVRVRGKGVGEQLLADAVLRVVSASRSLAVYAIVVDAPDDDAAAFYERFGFQRFVDRPDRLFLPTATVGEVLRRP